MRGYLPIVNVILAIFLVIVISRGIYPAVSTRPAPDLQVEIEEKEAGAPTAPDRQKVGDYQVINTRNIFYSEKISPAPPPKPIPTAVPTAPPTKLKLELKGTKVSSTRGKGVAFIKDLRTGKEDLYHVGDAIGDTGALIVSVERNKVTLKRGNQEEVLLAYKDESVAGTTASASTKKPETRKDFGDIIKVLSPYKREVSKSGLNTAVGNIFQYMDTSRIEVRRNYLNPKERKNQRGYKVWNIRRDSIVAAMGIKDNDIIMRVNRKLIDSPKKALTLFQEVQNAKVVKVEIERNRRRIRLSYKIKP